MAVLAFAAPESGPAAELPRLLGLRVSSGSAPFAGDGPLLATVSPNGDGFRDRAIVRFRLERPATVRLVVVRTDTIRVGRPGRRTVWRTSATFAPGERELVWRPSARTPPRTYLLKLTVSDRQGRQRVYDNPFPLAGSGDRAPVVRVQGVEAGFPKRSYAPGDLARLSLATDAQSLSLQVFHYTSQLGPREQDFKTTGTAMTGAVRVDWQGHRDSPGTIGFVRAGNWPSGLYFVRLRGGDGRLGYTPFIVRPRVPGRLRVGVVLSTNTWQAYNFWDADGDGWGDSWYVSGRVKRVDLGRPFLDFGIPFRFRDWDLDFIAWLNRTGKQVEFLSDDDLERFPSAANLAATYDLLVFPGHAEYVTARAYDLVQDYRDRGGNLMFLAANNFFWRVRRESGRLARAGLWRNLGRPEAGLVGVQYVGSDYGGRQSGYVVRGAEAEPWAFDGTGLRNGQAFGSYGIEIDARTAASPPGTRLLASIPDLMGPGRSAEMTYYETPSGAKVFAAGSLNFAASVNQPIVSRLLENVWARLSRP